jgi:hypothetical protein
MKTTRFSIETARVPPPALAFVADATRAHGRSVNEFSRPRTGIFFLGTESNS